MLFLDPGILQHGQVEVCQAAPPVAEHILHLLGDVDDVRATACKFFEHIHSWMPFISKKRFYDLYLPSSFQSRSDVVLLLLSLKLITTLPPTNPRNPRTSLYHAVKHFHLEVEGSSTFSLLVLQAAVLLALYELGHAIYPAAFLTVGICTRYAHALGINCSGSLQTRSVLTLVEVEERRKTWWAIVILDRLVPSSFYPLYDKLATIIGPIFDDHCSFVNIGCPGRPFATADPRPNGLLPADDTAWDQGVSCNAFSSFMRAYECVRLSDQMVSVLYLRH